MVNMYYLAIVVKWWSNNAEKNVNSSGISKQYKYIKQKQSKQSY